MREAMVFGREQTITYDEVQSAIRAKVLQKQAGQSGEANAENLNV